MGKGGMTGMAAALCALVCVPASASAADTTPPKTTILMTSQLDGGREKLYFFANEPVATIECRVDSDPWTPCMGAGPGHDWTTRGTNSGQHIAQVRSTDVAGNVESPPASHSFRGVLERPTILSGDGIVGPDTTWTNDPTPTFRMATSDPDVAEYRCGLDMRWHPGDPPPPFPPESCGAEWTPSVRVTDGKHSFHTYSVDRWGSASLQNEISFGVDTREPVVSVVTPGRVHKGTPVKIKLAAYDDNAEAVSVCLLDGKPIKCVPQTRKRLSRGTHRVSVFVGDPAGNVASARSKFRVIRR